MKYCLLFLAVLLAGKLAAQRATGNLVVITLDGLRWQELFGGMEDSLLADPRYTMDSATLRSKYGAATPQARRLRLMPFFWNTVAARGQVFGNPAKGSSMRVRNPYRVSYPGYNEIFTGYPDTAVRNNDKLPNPNENVLEFLNRQPGLRGKVAAFCSWKVFEFILPESRGNFLVSAGFDSIPLRSPRFDLLNEMQRISFQPFDEDIRPDMLTYYAAKEYLRVKQPRVLYIGFDETDDYAHEGKYDHYLNAAHLTDRWIEDLWNLLQSLPQYRNRTTLLITSDHGRGWGSEWTSHGARIEGADAIWMAVMGPGIPARGEAGRHAGIFQAQLAATIAELMGHRFRPAHPLMEGLSSLLR